MSYKSEDKEEETTKATNWTYKSAIMLGLALGIDSISLGVSAGFAHYPILLTSFFAGITSFLFIWTGSNFANRITFTLIKDKSDIVSGILLITLGIWQII
ncbi:manganese efflux pump MntP family protein [Serpentinicella alkaliphila]|nr:manganese efflux pump [Serpentinicella alkaliphila]QUH27191.1 manganese efflux pump [Serpentinicella alkaliphila]